MSGDSWTVSVVSLSAVVLTAYPAIQTGAVVDLDEVLDEHAEQIALTQIVGDQAVIRLEGSLDGTNWFDLSNYSGVVAAAAGTTTFMHVASSPQPARYIRSSGYGSGTVTTLVTSR